METGSHGPSLQPSHYATGFPDVNANVIVMEVGKRQSGVVLMISLVMLLLLTLITLTAVYVTSLEERMAGNLQNQNVAFQAAESALREAEASIDGVAAVYNPLLLSTGPFQNTASPVCVAGLCGETTPLQSELFLDPDGAVDGTVQTATTGIAAIAAEPEYVIELMRIEPSTDSSRVYATFRITARAWGADPDSFVQLQSTYRLHALSFAH